MIDETPGDRIGVIGLGYVGLPLALASADAGYDVVGVDVDSDLISALISGESYVNGISDEYVREHLGEAFHPTTSYEELESVDAVSICVPTPLRKTGRPNLSYVVNAIERLADVISNGTTIILESTVYPGATEELIVVPLSERGFEIGTDLYVGFSPERIDPGNETYGVTDIPKIVGGVTPGCGDRAEATYRPVFNEIVRVKSAREAELVKLVENTYRSVNIGLINELALVAHELDVDIWNVVEAAATKPFGFMKFYPGPGLGGHCIPIDPVYLSWKAIQHGIETRFIDLADTVNREMPGHIVQRVFNLLNQRSVPLSEASILVVGVAYKRNVSDTRESPAYDVVGEFADLGAEISYHDPFVPRFQVEGRTYESKPLTREMMSGVDCAVILTDHDGVDYAQVVNQTSLVFDARNATAGLGVGADHLHRL